MTGYRNEILRSLPTKELEALIPHFERVSFSKQQRIEHCNTAVPFVHFIENGIVAEICQDSLHVPVEVGLVGKDGFLGLYAFLYADKSLNQAVAQMAGEANRIRLDVLRTLTDRCVSLNTRLMQYAYLKLAQLSGTILSHTRANIEHQLARWLLMAHDRLDGDIIPLTHDTLSMMLGSPRPGVTTALAHLAGEGFVKLRRGEIHIINRKGLEEFAGVYYGAPERERSRLLARQVL
ncbi:MAG: Crp/Fnr family transcriptional regulator [Hyphomicrobiales bacterium]|nr:Crp/Fnr family transcriptional regulator [Hyphomicrobiales bacterium]